MKKLFLFLTIAFTLWSCADISPKGEIEVQDTEVQDFNAIHLKGNFKVFFARGNQNLVSVETYPNIFKNLDISVEDGILAIEENRTAKNVDFYTITVFGKKDLSDIVLEKRAELNISGAIKSSSISMSMEDKTKFMGAINADKSSIEMSGNANANVLGRAQNLTLKLKDSSSIVAPYFQIENLNITSEKDAFTAIQVEKKIDGSITGVSRLMIYGEPLNKVVKKDKASVEKGRMR